TFLRVIRTFASTKFTTSSFWHRCRRIGILNNFFVFFYNFFNFFRVFELFLYIYLFLFLFYYILKKYSA
ncbi:hypothetical protein ACMBCN_02170, partial [Candidatus Liberibacter asiaticus]|nr:hypothetical protein [Candidatus Liberibacter asiaticus]